MISNDLMPTKSILSLLFSHLGMVISNNLFPAVSFFLRLLFSYFLNVRTVFSSSFYFLSFFFHFIYLLFFGFVAWAKVQSDMNNHSFIFKSTLYLILTDRGFQQLNLNC